MGEVGVPNQIPFLSDWINEKYKFHDTVLSSIIQNALHAVAIDEIREVFNVTPMQQGSLNRKTKPFVRYGSPVRMAVSGAVAVRRVGYQMPLWYG